MDNQKLLDLLGETQRALLDKQTSLDAGEPTREEYESMRQVVLGTKEQLRKQEADASYWKQQFDSQLRAWEAAQTSNGFLKKDLRLAKRRAEEAEILRLQTEAKLKAILAEEAKDGLSLLDPSDLGGLSVADDSAGGLTDVQQAVGALSHVLAQREENIRPLQQRLLRQVSNPKTPSGIVFQGGAAAILAWVVATALMMIIAVLR